MSSLAVAPSTRELVFGRYRPIRPLGSGGSGSVWLAADERTGLDVALKIIPREGKAAARAEREALAARRLRHERCVRAYDVGHDSGHVYIAYEYVPGRTVREALQADVISDEESVEIGSQVLEALAHAHRSGIVHRDVKPSNVLLEDRDEVAVRLLDFGLAQFDDAETLTAVGDVPGTLAYIAPERLAGREATEASDVWAVGVLLWEALAGRHPFWGLPLQEVAGAITAGAPPLAKERPDLPRRLVAAVESALRAEPGKRPRASALAADLRAGFAAAAPDQKRRRANTPAARVSRPLSVRERLAAVGLAALTTALGATLLPFWPSALVTALVVAAALGAWLHPRIGLAIALAAPVFPLGNIAEGAAILYAVFAVAWLLLAWRDAGRGLLFATGPLLAPAGLLALIPLVIQPVRGMALRCAQGVLAVLAAVLVAGLSGDTLPLATVPAEPLRLTPLTPAGEVGSTVWALLTAHPQILAAAVLFGLAGAALPHARRLSRYGVAAVAAVTLVGAAAAGTGELGLFAAGLCWALATAVAASRAR